MTETGKSVGIGSIGFEPNGSLLVRLTKSVPVAGREPMREPETLTIEAGDDIDVALDRIDTAMATERKGNFPPMDTEARGIIKQAAKAYWTKARIADAEAVRKARADKMAADEAEQVKGREAAEKAEADRFDAMLAAAKERAEKKAGN